MDFADHELEALHGASVFEGVGDDGWALLAPCFERQVTRAGDEVLRRGDPSRGLFVVCSGRFQVLLEGRLVAEISAPAAFGELSLLAECAASATVRAVRDGVLARLPRESFDEVADSVPRLLRNLGGVAARRLVDLRGYTPAVAPTITNIAVLCFDERAHAGTFAHNIKSALTGGRVSEVVDQAFLDSQEGFAGPTAALSAIEMKMDVTLTVPDPSDSEWTRRCLRQADRVVLLAMGDSNPRLPAAEVHVMDLVDLDRVDVFLVLLHPPDTEFASDTIEWLQRRELAGHYHVRLGSQEDYGRVGRMLTDTGIGFVLGGASTRGIAHLGVAEALRRAKVPIDVVVGSSSGALMAGLLALEKSHVDTVDMAVKGLAGVAPKPSTMGPPIVSIASGKVPVESGKATWGDLRLEDLFLTCIFTATDLARSALVQLTRGPIWKTVRAATSLPVIWPPVVDGDQVLIDGGVLDNIPVASVAPRCRRGMMFAADFNPPRGDSVLPAFADLEPYGEVLSGWGVAWNKYAPGGKPKRFPGLGTTLTYTMLLSSIRHAADLERDKPINLELLRIALPDEGFFAVDAAAGQRLVDHAEEAAAPAVRDAWTDYRAGRRSP